MGYLHIGNLYKDQDILLFKECYALEKVHGTSAHISWKFGKLSFFSGGASHTNFVQIFDEEALHTKFMDLGHTEVTVYGEAYGGKEQGMGNTYGKELRFIVFDVKIGELWLSVPDMEKVAQALGLEVVPWKKISTDLAALDAERDAPSEVAIRRGCGEKPREGVVLRPLIEVRKNNDERVIAKHKTEKFSERSTPQRIVDPAKLEVLKEANAIAEEWVTPMRLTHVLDKLPKELNIEGTKQVISAMIEDVLREAENEIVDSKEARSAIGKRTAILFKERLKAKLRETIEGGVVSNNSHPTSV